MLVVVAVEGNTQHPCFGCKEHLLTTCRESIVERAFFVTNHLELLILLVIPHKGIGTFHLGNHHLLTIFVDIGVELLAIDGVVVVELQVIASLQRAVVNTNHIVEFKRVSILLGDPSLCGVAVVTD